MSEEDFIQNENYDFEIKGAGNNFSTAGKLGSIGQLQYPKWLGADRINDYSQMHYMVIYINEVQSGPRYEGKDSKYWTDNLSPESPMSYSTGSNIGTVNVNAAKEGAGKALNGMMSRASEWAEKKNKEYKLRQHMESISDTASEAYASAKKEWEDATAGVKSFAENHAEELKLIERIGNSTPILGSMMSAAGPVAEGVGAAAGFVGEVGSGVVSGLADGFKQFLSKIGPKVSKLKTIVALPVPDMLNTSYSANWTTANTGEVGSLLNMAAKLGDANGVAEASRQITGMFAYNGAMGMTNALGNLGNALTKTTYNERSEGVYMGHQPRFFSFQWTLYPEDAEDSKAIWDIIQTLKYYSLPEEDTSEFGQGRWLIQPAIFDIEFWSHDKRNDWIPRTLSCALTKIDVNYTPTGKFATFDHNDTRIDGNAPIGISLGLEFQEIETLTKQRIAGNNFDFRTGDKSSVGGML